MVKRSKAVPVSKKTLPQIRAWFKQAEADAKAHLAGFNGRVAYQHRLIELLDAEGIEHDLKPLLPAAAE